VQGAEIGGEADDREVIEVHDRLEVQDRLEGIMIREAVAVDDRGSKIAEGVIDRCHVIILSDRGEVSRQSRRNNFSDLFRRAALTKQDQRELS